MTMKSFIAGHEVVTENDALELALGTPLELWLGVSDESGEERAARLDAARDILAEEPELYDRVTALVAEGLAAMVSGPSTVRSVGALLSGEAA
ncbi:hypothetical protein ITI46_06670 [Streptomyces oryzae]|uniref:Uncharacterized protein n=1 Tax=Streptomyces oryzae TaxID=1434886 RepID=A0ABS3X8H5_9ACTN|nr:hypothetical protein [Streptomyces oryzae]MBO8191376.1 hypothetical protein [Streptomyces oryzae]